MIEFVRFTKSGGPLTKRLSLGDDGKLKSDGSACVMTSGAAERIRIADINDFAEVISALRSDQAIALGRLRPDLPDSVSVVPKKMVTADTPVGVIARTTDNIIPGEGPGLALIDYDVKGMPPAVAAKVATGIWTALTTVMPVLRTTARLLRVSTSAGIRRTDTGEAVNGSDGLHIYCAVKDTADRERFVRTLHDRCWLAGLGWYMVGAGGQLLERSIVDRMVFGSERLVFEGDPVVDPPLAQDRAAREPKVRDGDLLDTVIACPPLTVLEKVRLAELKAKAEHALTGESAKARTEFIRKQAQRLSRRSGVSPSVAGKIVAAWRKGILLPNIELTFDDPALAGKTVADVLADPEGFEGETLADPLEGIEYGRCKAKIMLRADGMPWINSFAHGRTTYEMKLDAAAVGAVIDQAAKDDVLPTFVRVTGQAHIDAVELEELVKRVSQRSDATIPAIRAVLKEAKKAHAKEEARQERTRRMAENTDPRPTIAIADANTPWLEEVKLYCDALSAVNEPVPPARDVNDVLVSVQVIVATTLYAFATTEGAEQ